MARMITASGSTDLSGYGNRRVTIEVSGGGNSELSRQAAYTVTVPYSSFSKTIQDIQRRGGQVMNVSLSNEQDTRSRTSRRTSRQQPRKQARNQQPKKQADKKPKSKGRFQLIKTFKFS